MSREQDRPWRRRGIDWKDPEAVKVYKREWQRERRKREIEAEVKRCCGQKR